jgi:uncharacterized protein
VPSELKIQVGGLSEGRFSHRFHSRGEELSLGEDFTGEVLVDTVLEKRGRQILLSAAISTTGTFECDRCLEDFKLTVNPSYRTYYVMDGEDAAGMDPAEVQVIPAGLPVIDITDDVRQMIELSVPLKLLCRPDCQGLCPTCGKNLNVSPCACQEETPDGPWDTLKSLKNNPT